MSDGSGGRGELQSLRARMLRRVLVPLAVTWLAGNAIALYTAATFAGRAFDRSLLDDAYAIAANVALRDGRLVLGLSPRELGNLLYDHSEEMHFAVVDAQRRLVAGEAGMQSAPPEADAADFSNRVHKGLQLRTVTLAKSEPVPFVVTVGQTTRTRHDLLRSLLVGSMFTQVILLAILARALHGRIGRELEPLRRLQNALGRRDAADLTPLQLLPVSRDVARLEQAINGLLARLEQGVATLREFAGNVAHDLRTPLAGIGALAEYGLARDDPAVWRRQLSSIVESQQRASRMVEQLLALAFAEEARLGVHLEAVDVDEIVRRTVLESMPRADAQGVDLGAEGLDRPTRAIGNRALLEGALNNLLDNALRYGRPEQGAAVVTVGVSAASNRVWIDVEDNGPGLDPAQAERLRSRWAQGEPGQSLGEGAGLGLAIASRYAELMKGRLLLDRGADGKGLRARLCIAAAQQRTSGQAIDATDA